MAPEVEDLLEDEDAAETPSEDVEEGQPESGEAVEEGEVEETVEPEPETFGDLPFKSKDEFVKAYKSLQREFTTRNEEMKNLQSTMNNLLPYLTKADKAEAKANPEEFFRAFISDPQGTLAQLISHAVQEQVRAGLNPVMGQIKNISLDKELEAFVSKHSELTDADEDGILETIEKYPEVLTRQDRLDVIYRLYVLDHPEVGERSEVAKREVSKGLNAAKTAAGLGGRRAAKPVKPEKDEFDEIYEFWKARKR